MFVAIEGLDSSGKATQAERLTLRLNRVTARPCKLLSFPRYDTTVGRVIKRHLRGTVSLREEHSIDSSDHTIDGFTVHRLVPEDALMFQCLMLADKAEVARQITATLSNGAHVVCDRWIASALCYGQADGLDGVWLTRIHDMLPEANLNIFIDVPPEEALRRRLEARDRYERDREKQARVRENYKALWSCGVPSYVTVDGLGTVEEVAERIWAHVQKVQQ